MGIAEWMPLVGIGVTVLVVGLVILVSLRLSRRFHAARPKPASAASTPPWIWTLMIMLVAIIAYLSSGKNPPAQPAPAWLSPEVFMTVGIGLFMFVFVILYTVSYFRSYDRVASRALKRAQLGDKDGALAELKAAMVGQKPSATRSNVLGLIHSSREEWAEARAAFGDAQAIDGRQAVYLANQGVALLKLGRPGEAEPLLREARAMQPAIPLFATNLGLVLVELGRFDEARAELLAAEQVSRRLVWASRSSRKELADEIEALRARLADEPATG